MNSPLLWAEINVAAIRHNVAELRRITHSDAELMVAVKANGYGHGAVETARAALAGGASQLGVARLEEALELRDAGIMAPVLIFGYTPGAQAPLLAEHSLKASVFSFDNALRLSDSLNKNQKIDIHVKVDTGMGRLGLIPETLWGEGIHDAMPPETAVDEIRRINGLGNLRLEGLWTHFAASDEEDKSYTRGQLDHFKQLAQDLAQDGVTAPLYHAANSGAIIDLPESHMNMVRAGIAVYGLYPSSKVMQQRVRLIPAMTLKTRIVHLKRVPRGANISYGCTWTAPGPTTIATVALGYGDGFSRALSNKGQMLAGGKRAPVVGRVCMDLTMIDVGEKSDVQVGDEVVVIGRQGDEQISADEIARLIGTINYEVVTGLMARVRRKYVNDNL